MSDSVFDQDGYPPAAFYFRVVFDAGSEVSDTSFQEVSGISAEIDIEDLVEGGENTYVHHLPKAVKHTPLELKRGIASNSSKLVKWCQDTLEHGLMQAIKTRLVKVDLMSAEGNPIRSWTFANAYPVKWEVEGFGASKNEVAIEKIVLRYSYSNRLL